MEHVNFYDLESIISLLREYQIKGMKNVGFDVCDENHDLIVFSTDNESNIFTVIDLGVPDA